MKRFCEGVIEVYGDEVLRYPTMEDINKLLDEGNKSGFPGCIGSIDCMHWEWKNCPSAWKGMFRVKVAFPPSSSKQLGTTLTASGISTSDRLEH